MSSRRKTTITTNAQVDNARSQRNGKPATLNTHQKNLFLKVTASGLKTWLFICRVAGQREQITLGHYPGMTFSQAKEQARHWGSVSAGGQSPRQVNQEQLQISSSSPVQTVSELLAEFDSRHIAKNMSDPDTPRGRIKKWIQPHLGKLKLVDVQKPHFINLANRIEDTGAKVEHTKIIKLCRQIWEFAVTRGYIETNPVPVIKSTSKSRERYLSVDEITRLWRDADRSKREDRVCKLNRQHTLAWKLIVLTGQRVGSLLGTRVEHFDLEAGTWTIPAELMKGGRQDAKQPHTVHLSPLAASLVSELMANRKTGLLITGVRDKTKPLTLSTFDRAHGQWLKNMGIPHATVHDYRRALSTHCAGLEIAPHVVEKILAHQMKGVMAVYNRAEYLQQRKQALHAYSDWIESITTSGNSQTSNVLRFNQVKTA